MRYRFGSFLTKTAIVLSFCQATAWHVAQAQPLPAVIPFAEGVVVPHGSGSLTIFVRKIDGGYLDIQATTTIPYTPLNVTAQLLQLLSAGIKKLAAAPMGPPGVGLASQFVAIADITGNGSVGGAFVGNGFVNVVGSSNGISFNLGNTYAIGEDVNSVFFADFNGDGLPDLAVAYDGGSSPGGIAILLNQGNGTFAKPVTYASGTPATTFAVLDLNHDRVLDIATAAINGTATVLLGKGDGTFGPARSYAIGTLQGAGSGQAIAIADVNGDGNPDLIVGGSTGILLGSGDGTFHAGSPLPAAASTTFIWAYAAGDLNGDGKMDLAYADIQNQVVAPLFGNGDGTFRAAPGPGDALSQLPISLILTDFNNDGRLDIVNGSGDQRIFGPGHESGITDILLNNGDETFQGVPDYFTIGNGGGGDGYSVPVGLATAKFGGTFPGILAAGSDHGLTLFVGNGKGGFESPQRLEIQGGPAVAAADFNKDGIGDAAVSEGNDGVTILLGTSSGFGSPTNISTGGVFPAAMVAADFNGDGNADLAVIGQSNGTGTLAILLGNGTGDFQAAVMVPAGVTPTSLAAADFNGDGQIDLVFADSGTNDNNGGVYVALNAGHGTFQTPVQVASGLLPAVGVGDINGDGKLDLVVASQTGDGETGVSWLAGKTNGQFQAPVNIASVDGSVNAVLVADFNNDGNADIALASPDTGESGDTLYLSGNGQGAFSATTTLLGPAEPTLLLSTDLRGNGKPDLIVGGDTMVVLLNKGITSAIIVSAANPSAAPMAPGSLATAYGADLANSKPGGASLPLPISLGGTSVSILDSSGTATPAPLLYVTPSQVNFEVPPGIATGVAQVTVNSGDGTQSVANVPIAAVAPGVFELNGSGLAAAYVILYHSDGTQTVEQVYTVKNGAVVASPVSLGSSTDQAYLFLFGTGFEAARTAGVKVSVGGMNLPVSFAGSQGGFTGLDQANVELSSSLKGKGNVSIQLTANGIAANTVNMTIQ